MGSPPSLCRVRGLGHKGLVIRLASGKEGAKGATEVVPIDPKPYTLSDFMAGSTKSLNHKILGYGFGLQEPIPLQNRVGDKLFSVRADTYRGLCIAVILLVFGSRVFC